MTSQAGVIYAGVIGGADTLRRGVEGLLTDDASIDQQLQEQELRAQAGGWQPTFAEEVEYKFIANPDTNFSGVVPDKELAYEEIVAECLGSNLRRFGPIAGRGKIVNPRAYSGDILVHAKINGSHNPYQPGTDISELHSAPSMDVLTSVERYWKMIDAIGRVAARYNCIGLILGTDTNMCFYRYPIAPHGKPVDLNQGVGTKLVAATQYNLGALFPLQIDAGLETRTVVDEALPNKNAASCIHAGRLERKCSLVGVTDPRIARLAGLAALNQYISKTIPSAALKASRACQIMALEGNSRFLDDFNSGLVVWDKISGLPIFPAELHGFGFAQDDEKGLNDLVGYLTDGSCTDFMQDNGIVLRQAFGCVTFDRQKRCVQVDTTKPYGSKMLSQLGGVDYDVWYETNRIVPSIKEDSPEIHLRRRAALAKSSTVRAILGSATRSLVPAPESVNRRAKLIAEEMYDFRDLDIT